MFERIDANEWVEMLRYGILNLSCNKEYVNGLNVFPVPDGDTGTNMVLTLENGVSVLPSEQSSMKNAAESFSKAVIFGARGNSGVILSQFFRGMAEVISARESIDAEMFSRALKFGTECAYGSVNNPVEGTMLTVIREASEHVESCLACGRVGNLEDLLSAFTAKAKQALDETPEKLAVLKDAGVVDSGGAGILFIFEGFRKYFAGEKIEGYKSAKPDADVIDYSRFNSDSVFDYGYCTELLIQTSGRKRPYDSLQFRKDVEKLGESAVVSEKDGKIKLHIHTDTPENVLGYCHEYGEFLNLKIENMSVQHSNLPNGIEISGRGKGTPFAVIVVASDREMAKIYTEMGADIVMTVSPSYSPSAQDFLDAFGRADQKNVLVFPNSKQFMLSAEQAKALYGKTDVTLIDSKSASHCYSALSMIDYGSENISEVVGEINRVIGNIYTVKISRAVRDSKFDGTVISKNDYIAISEERLIAVGRDLVGVACEAVEKVMKTGERDVVTLFSGINATDEQTKAISDRIAIIHKYTETDIIKTGETAFDLLLSFE